MEGGGGPVCEFSFGSEVRPLKSAVATVIGGIQYLYLSPDAGVTTVEDMSDTEFLMIGINPDMLGQVLDMYLKDSYYTFFDFVKERADESINKKIEKLLEMENYEYLNNDFKEQVVE